MLRHDPYHLWLHLSSHHHCGVHLLLLALLHHVLLLWNHNCSLGKLLNLLLGKYLWLTKTSLILNLNNNMRDFVTYGRLNKIFRPNDVLKRLYLLCNNWYLLLLALLSYI